MIEDAIVGMAGGIPKKKWYSGRGVTDRRRIAISVLGRSGRPRKRIGMSLEYVVYTDESEKRGKFYSNFYGGVLVRSPDLQPVIDRLEQHKIRFNLYREVKWQKVTENYL